MRVRLLLLALTARAVAEEAEAHIRVRGEDDIVEGALAVGRVHFHTARHTRNLSHRRACEYLFKHRVKRAPF